MYSEKNFPRNLEACGEKMVSKKDIFKKVTGLEKNMQDLQSKLTHSLLKLEYPRNFIVYFSSNDTNYYIKKVTQLIEAGYTIKSIYDCSTHPNFYCHTEFWAKEDGSKNDTPGC